MRVYGERGEDYFRRDLATGGVRECTKVGEGPGSKDLHRWETSDGGSVGVPPSHIRSVCATGDRLQGWG